MKRWIGSTVVVAMLGACNEYEFYTQKQTDIFQQNRRNVVDILLVVDNSCSMVEEQDKLAGNFNNFIQAFQGVDVDYQIGVITTDTVQEEFQGRFVGGDDEIVFSNAFGHELDRVKYTWDWEWAEGAALALNPDKTSPSQNDAFSNWCVATEAYGDGDFGTPGEPNPACGTSGPVPPDTGAAAFSGEDSGATLATPTVGSVVITEFMSNPDKVDDTMGEWVEITNASTDDLDLSGSTLSDDGRNLFLFPDGSVLPQGESIVVGRSADTAVNGGLQVDFEAGEAFTLNNRTRILTPASESASEIFSEMVAVGITGSGIEMGLEAARLALSAPLVETENAGFLREEANLAFIFVSDEDDSSPYPADDYLHFFTQLKGEDAFRDHSLMKVSAVVGSKEPDFSNQPSCSSIHGDATFGHRYVHLTSKTEGQLESICDEDFSELTTELGLILSGLSLEFELSERPDENTIEVSLYETADTLSLVGRLTKGEDYVYMSDRNAIRFQEDQIPPAQYFIEVRYTVLATGTEEVEAVADPEEQEGEQ